MSKLKVNRVKTIIRNVIENNLDLANLGIVPKALAIEGEPGTAKTSAVAQVVNEYADKFNYIKLDLSGLTTDDQEITQ
jgi:MoxR-like ATPase